MEENEDKKKELNDNNNSENETKKPDEGKSENRSLNVLESIQRECEEGTKMLKEISDFFKSDSLLSKLSATVDSAYNNSALKNLQKTCEILSNPAIDFAKNISLPTSSALESIRKYFESFSVINNSLTEWIESFSIPTFPNLSGYFTRILGEKIERKQYQDALYQSKWFPYIDDLNQLQLMLDIIDVVKRSKSKNSIDKKIDKIYFAFFDYKKIEEIRKNWRFANLNNTIIRMLNNAVKSFHRKEYALTVCALMSIWERIIKDKLSISCRIGEKKQKESLDNLIVENNVDEPINKFCTDFVFYECNSMGDVIPDVPGRHGIAHGWFDKYPSKKAALNAILFTDFLIWLQPKEDKEKA